MTDVQRFLKRVGLDPDMTIVLNLDFLKTLQSHCVCSIAYENLDILAGIPLDLSYDALFDKLVTRNRGGYCFESNGLLFHMLRRMGFSVTERFARFLRGETVLPMRRHRLSVVSLPDGDYMVDIGIGQVAPREPLKIAADLTQIQGKESYRFCRTAQNIWILQELHHGQWQDYLCFSDEEAYEVDFIQPSFFCEKHPDSIFNKVPKLAIKTPDGRCTVDGSTYKEFREEQLVSIEENISSPRLRQLCGDQFQLSNIPNF